MRLVEIELGAGVDDGVARAEHGGQHVLQRVVQALVVRFRLLLLDGPGGDVAGVSAGGVQDVTVAVDDGHIVGREPLDARGDQVDDGLDLLGRQGGPGLERDQDRSRRLVRAGGEQALLGDDDVYDRTTDPAYGLDGLFQLVGDGLLVLDLLLELRGRHPAAVEQGVALLPGRGQAGRRHVQALLVDVAGRDHNLLAAFGQLVGDFVGGQFLRYCGRVGGAQVGKKRHIGRLGRP